MENTPEWRCPTCRAGNTADEIECPCCQTVRPGSGVEANPLACLDAKLLQGPPITFGFNPSATLDKSVLAESGGPHTLDDEPLGEASSDLIATSTATSGNEEFGGKTNEGASPESGSVELEAGESEAGVSADDSTMIHPSGKGHINDEEGGYDFTNNLMSDVAESDAPSDDSPSAAGLENKVPVEKIPSKEFSEGDHKLSGDLFCWGSGDCDQMPFEDHELNDELAQKFPIRIPKLPVAKKVIEVTCGALHAVARLQDGTLWSWGCNDDYPLGRPTKDSEERFPGKVQHLPDYDPVVGVSCGDNHTAALTSSGKCFLWGSYKDSAGYLGFPDFQGSGERSLESMKCLVPTQVPLRDENNTEVFCKQLRSGENHTIVLSTCGVMYIWGSSEFGQLGLAPIADDDDKVRFLFPQKQTVTSMRLVNDGETTTIKDIFSGHATTFVSVEDTTSSNGTSRVFGAGRNGRGELGIGIEDIIVPQFRELEELRDKQVVQLEGGQYFSAALTRDGKLYSWGNRELCGLGRSSKDVRSPRQVTSLPPIIQIGAGGGTCYCISEEGHLYSWGEGQMYQLGNGVDDENPSVKPHLVNPSLLNSRYVIRCTGGSHHAVALIWDHGKVVDAPQQTMRKLLEAYNAQEPPVTTYRAKRTRDEVGEEEGESETPQVRSPPAKALRTETPQDVTVDDTRDDVDVDAPTPFTDDNEAEAFEEEAEDIAEVDTQAEAAVVEAKSSTPTQTLEAIVSPLTGLDVEEAVEPSVGALQENATTDEDSNAPLKASAQTVGETTPKKGKSTSKPTTPATGKKSSPRKSARSPRRATSAGSSERIAAEEHHAEPLEPISGDVKQSPADDDGQDGDSQQRTPGADGERCAEGEESAFSPRSPSSVKTSSSVQKSASSASGGVSVKRTESPPARATASPSRRTASPARKTASPSRRTGSAKRTVSPPSSSSPLRPLSPPNAARRTPSASPSGSVPASPVPTTALPLPKSASPTGSASRLIVSPTAPGESSPQSAVVPSKASSVSLSGGGSPKSASPVRSDSVSSSPSKKSSQVSTSLKNKAAKTGKTPDSDSLSDVDPLSSHSPAEAELEHTGFSPEGEGDGVSSSPQNSAAETTNEGSAIKDTSGNEAFVGSEKDESCHHDTPTRRASALRQKKDSSSTSTGGSQRQRGAGSTGSSNVSAVGIPADDKLGSEGHIQNIEDLEPLGGEGSDDSKPAPKQLTSIEEEEESEELSEPPTQKPKPKKKGVTRARQRKVHETEEPDEDEQKDAHKATEAAGSSNEEEEEESEELSEPPTQKPKPKKGVTRARQRKVHETEEPDEDEQKDAHEATEAAGSFNEEEEEESEELSEPPTQKAKPKKKGVTRARQRKVHETEEPDEDEQKDAHEATEAAGSSNEEEEESEELSEPPTQKPKPKKKGVTRARQRKVHETEEPDENEQKDAHEATEAAGSSEEETNSLKPSQRKRQRQANNETTGKQSKVAPAKRSKGRQAKETTEETSMEQDQDEDDQEPEENARKVKSRTVVEKEEIPTRQSRRGGTQRATAKSSAEPKVASPKKTIDKHAKANVSKAKAKAKGKAKPKAKSQSSTREKAIMSSDRPSRKAASASASKQTSSKSTTETKASSEHAGKTTDNKKTASSSSTSSGTGRTSRQRAPAAQDQAAEGTRSKTKNGTSSTAPPPKQEKADTVKNKKATSESASQTKAKSGSQQSGSARARSASKGAQNRTKDAPAEIDNAVSARAARATRRRT